MVQNTDGNDEIRLADIVRPIQDFLREMNRPLMLLSLALAVIVALAVMLKPRYDASALLDAPNLSLDEWRDIRSLLSDEVLLKSYFESQKKAVGEARADSLMRQLAQESYWEKHAQFRTALQRGDEKIAPSAQVAKTPTLGIEITLTASSEESGLAQLRTLAGHIQATLHWSYLRRFIQSFTQEVDRRRTEIDAELVRLDFAIEQSTRRIAEMKRVLTSYPESRRLDTVSVVSVEGGGDKFLSPVAQLIALETTISDANAAKRTAARELEKLDWKMKYARQIAGAYDKYHTGKALDTFLTDSLKQVFAQEGGRSSAAAEEYYDITMKLTGLRQRADQFVFKSSPKVSDKPIRSRNPAFMGPAAFMVGYLLLAIIFWVHRRSAESNTPPAAPWDMSNDSWLRNLPAGVRRWLFGR